MAHRRLALLLTALITAVPLTLAHPRPLRAASDAAALTSLALGDLAPISATVARASRRLASLPRSALRTLLTFAEPSVGAAAAAAPTATWTQTVSARTVAVSIFLPPRVSRTVVRAYVTSDARSLVVHVGGAPGRPLSVETVTLAAPADPGSPIGIRVLSREATADDGSDGEGEAAPAAPASSFASLLRWRPLVDGAPNVPPRAPSLQLLVPLAAAAAQDVLDSCARGDASSLHACLSRAAARFCATLPADGACASAVDADACMRGAVRNCAAGRGNGGGRGGGGGTETLWSWLFAAAGGCVRLLFVVVVSAVSVVLLGLAASSAALAWRRVANVVSSASAAGRRLRGKLQKRAGGVQQLPPATHTLSLQS
jgi:hypothetical protein